MWSTADHVAAVQPSTSGKLFYYFPNHCDPIGRGGPIRSQDNSKVISAQRGALDPVRMPLHDFIRVKIDVYNYSYKLDQDVTQRIVNYLIVSFFLETEDTDHWDNEGKVEVEDWVRAHALDPVS